jgi:hypothetical protein
MINLITIEKQLDAIINFHKTYKHSNIYSYKENPYGFSVGVYDTNETKITQNAIKKLIDDFELIEKQDLIVELYEQLKEDKHLIFDHEKSANKVTIKGLLFEGYEQEKQDKINERNRQVSTEQSVKDSTAKLARWTKYLTYGTIGIVIATLLLFLAEIAKDWDYFAKLLNLCPCNC